MKTKRSLLHLKKITVASIRTLNTIMGAGQSASCPADTTTKTTSTDDPFSQARRGCAAGSIGGNSN